MGNQNSSESTLHKYGKSPDVGDRWFLFEMLTEVRRNNDRVGDLIDELKKIRKRQEEFDNRIKELEYTSLGSASTDGFKGKIENLQEKTSGFSEEDVESIRRFITVIQNGGKISVVILSILGTIIGIFYTVYELFISKTGK